MKISTSWLQEYIDKLLTTEQMVGAIEAAGVEIEAIIKPIKMDKKVIAVKIVDIKPHPNADKLRLATVDMGTEKLQVVCGAPDIKVGQIVPLAPIGAVLSDGAEMKLATIRGIDSPGMLCTSAELGISEDHSLMRIDENITLGTPLNDVLGTQDTIVDVKTAANRSDLNSIIGIAREVAAHTESKLKIPFPDESPVSASKSSELFTNDYPKKVYRYSLAKLKIKRVGEAPEWMKQRLTASGIKSINAVVDITNYVMLEYGQPLHAFDADKVVGPMVIRLAKSGESLQTLDGAERKLNSSDIVIADNSGVIDLAGIMGGRSSEISDITTMVLLEAATFDGPTVRRTALNLGLRTEASARFERKLPTAYVGLARQRAIELLVEIADARIETEEDGPAALLRTTEIKTTSEKLTRLAGFQITGKQIENALKKLEFGYVVDKNTTFKVKVPFWRPDVSIEEDIFEEIIKIIGLDKVPARLPDWKPDKIENDKLRPALWKLRSILQGLGLSEITTYPFVSHSQLTDLGLDPNKHLKLQNPRSHEQSHLRTTLLSGMLEAIAVNTRIHAELALFEIGRVFLPNKGILPNESRRLGIIVQTEVPAYLRIKNLVDQLQRLSHTEFRSHLSQLPYFSEHQVEATSNDQAVGKWGELHPAIIDNYKIKQAIAYLEIDLDVLIEQWGEPTFHAVSKYQTIGRSLTVVLDQDITWEQIIKFIDVANIVELKFGGDYYAADLGDHKKALTLKFTIGSNSKTLTDEEADKVVGQVQQLLEQNFGAHSKD